MQPKTLKLGDYGKDVAQLHQWLEQQGIEIAVEEKSRQLFGAATREAVQTYQQRQGLNVTGELDEATITAIAPPALTPPPPERLSPPVSPDLRQPELPAIPEMEDRDRDRYLVTGRIRTTEGLPVPGLTIQAFDKKVLREPTLLGNATTNEEGTYRLDYTDKVTELGLADSVDLLVQCRDASGTLLQQSPLMVNAPRHASVDFTVAKSLRLAPALFGVRDRQFRQLIGDGDPAALKEDDFAYLTAKLNLDRPEIHRLIHARTLAQAATSLNPEVTLPLAIFYALARGETPPDLPAIVNQPRATLTQTLQQAIADNLIQLEPGQTLETVVSSLKELEIALAWTTPENPDTYTLRNLVDCTGLDEASRRQFVRAYTLNEKPLPEFWKDLSDSTKNPDLSRHATTFQKLFDLAALTENTIPLIRALSRHQVGLRQFARFDAKTWNQYFRRYRLPLTEAEAAKLTQRLQKQYPTVHLLASLKRDRVLTSAEKPSRDLQDFCDRHLDFVFGQLSVNQYLNQETIQQEFAAELNAIEQDDLKRELRHLELAYLLAPQADKISCIAALRALNLVQRQPPLPARSEPSRLLPAASTSRESNEPVIPENQISENQSALSIQPIKADSAIKIATTNPATFFSAWKQVRQGQGMADQWRVRQEAEEIYKRARYLAFLTTFNAWNAASALDRVLPAFCVPAQRRNAAALFNRMGGTGHPQLWNATALLKNQGADASKIGIIANLQTLFGQSGYCECIHCQSIYGPARYLVELYTTLPPTLKAQLDYRRLDILTLHLNCENTHTQLPYIDLVNELLEGWVGNLKGRPHNLQTTHRQEELALRPEHEEPYAYIHLSLLPYPLSLPWDKWFEEARRYLNYLGLPLHHLVAVFMSQSQPWRSANFDLWQHRQAQWCNDQVVRAHLGLTVPLYDLIAKPITLTTDTQFGSYFLPDGSALFNHYTLDQLRSLDTFMKCLGLWRGDAQGDTGAKDFELVREILGCRYVNPNNGIQLNYQKQPENDDPCDINNYDLTNLTSDFLVRLTKFEHLRRILGWRPRELNQTILVLDKQGTLDETVLQLISHLVRLQQKKAKISVMELLSWWGDIETGAGWQMVKPCYEGESKREENCSLYERVFLNKSLYGTKPEEQDKKSAWPYFQLNDLGIELRYLNGNAAPSPITDFNAILAAALGLREKDLAELLNFVQKNYGDGQDSLTITLDLETLSNLYRVVSLSRYLKLSIREFVLVHGLLKSQQEPFLPPNNSPFSSTSNTLRFVEAVEQIQRSPFKIQDLAYLWHHQTESLRELENINKRIEDYLPRLQKSLQEAQTQALLVSPTGEIIQLIAQVSESVEGLTQRKKPLLDWLKNAFSSTPRPPQNLPFLPSNQQNGLNNLARMYQATLDQMASNSPEAANKIREMVAFLETLDQLQDIIAVIKWLQEVLCQGARLGTEVELGQQFSFLLPKQVRNLHQLVQLPDGLRPVIQSRQLTAFVARAIRLLEQLALQQEQAATVLLTWLQDVLFQGALPGTDQPKDLAQLVGLYRTTLNQMASSSPAAANKIREMVAFLRPLNSLQNSIAVTEWLREVLCRGALPGTEIELGRQFSFLSRDQVRSLLQLVSNLPDPTRLAIQSSQLPAFVERAIRLLETLALQQEQAATVWLTWLQDVLFQGALPGTEADLAKRLLLVTPEEVSTLYQLQQGVPKPSLTTQGVDSANQIAELLTTLGYSEETIDQLKLRFSGRDSLDSEADLAQQLPCLPGNQVKILYQLAQRFSGSEGLKRAAIAVLQPPAAVAAALVQDLASFFNLDVDQAKALATLGLGTALGQQHCLVQALLTWITNQSAVSNDTLKQLLLQFDKSAALVRGWQLCAAEIRYIGDFPAAFQGFTFHSLPISSDAAAKPTFQQWSSLATYAELRQQIALKDDDLVGLFRRVQQAQASSLATTPPPSNLPAATAPGSLGNLPSLGDRLLGDLATLLRVDAGELQKIAEIIRLYNRTTHQLTHSALTNGDTLRPIVDVVEVIRRSGCSSDQLLRWVRQKHYDLTLRLESLDSQNSLPSTGMNIMIVAKISHSYHVRIFDRTGNIVLDKGSGEFLPDAILVQQLDAALASQTSEIFDTTQKNKLIKKIASSLGYIPTESNLALEASFVKGLYSVDYELLLYKDSVVEEIRNAVRANVGDSSWQEVARKQQDTMRILQRDKLLDAFLVVLNREAEGHSTTLRYLHIENVEDVYDFLLIDPLVNPCMQTTRLKQAISSVQLLIHRALMGLEDEFILETLVEILGLEDEDPEAQEMIKKIRQVLAQEWQKVGEEWQWKKRYRLWEAQQKVLLYPENWIEPELRDDKTPFFKEFETELSQSELNEKVIEQAYKNYLSKVDEVGHLEVAAFTESEDELHIIGRTRETPRTHYYRKRTAEGIWLPWERVELDIDSEVVLMIVHQGTLYVFWPTIKERVQKLGKDDPNDENNDKNNYRQLLEIRFNWSRHENGRWSSRKRTLEKVQLMYDWKYQDLYTDPAQLIEYDIQGNQNITISLSIISSASIEEEALRACDWNEKKLEEKFNSINDVIERLKCDISDADYPGWCYLCTWHFATQNGFPDRRWWKQLSNGEWEPITDYMKRMVWETKQHVYPITNVCPGINTPISLETLQQEINDHLHEDEPEQAIDKLRYKVRNNNLKYWLQTYPSVCPNVHWNSAFHSDRIGFTDSNNPQQKLTQQIILDDFVNNWANIRWTDIELFSYRYRSLVINTRGIGQNVRMKFAEMKFSGYKLREEARSFTGLMTKTNEFETSEFDSVIDGEPIAYYPLYNLPTFLGSIYLFQLRDSTEYPDLGFKVNSKANTLVLSSKESTPFCLRSINSENYSETKSYSLFDMSQRSAWLVGKSYNLLWWPGNYFAGKFQHFFFHDIKFCHEMKRVEGNFSYECYPFYHPFTESFNNAIYNNSVVSSWDRFDKLLTLDVQTKTEDFPYLPIPSDSIVKINSQDGTNIFVPPSPDIPYHTVEFGFTQPFGLYNWEIFFHMPFTLAVRLSQNKQFEQAQRWFHYIFNPLKPVEIEGGNYTNEADRKAASYWNFWPLHQLGMPDKISDQEWIQTVNDVAKDPFNPHRIARARLGAYQKAVVIKYLDNLIAWGDHLFQQDTLETINEATHLYILAAKILGPRPKVLPKQQIPTVNPDNPDDDQSSDHPTLVTLTNYFEDLEKLEQGITDPNILNQLSSSYQAGISSGIGQILTAQGYWGDPLQPAFCIPHNDHLLRYWDTVADRLFKIRNCRNIAGQVRELPIFEPPIDPALLVRGVALNVDISELLSDLYTPLPPYRFRVMLQKALEFCGDVQRLGGALLSALEKRDAEALSLLRSQHERQMLKLNESIRKQQIEELKETLKATHTSLVMAEGRFEYYSSREFENSNEKAEVILLNIANAFNIAGQAFGLPAAAAYAIPNIHANPLGAPTVETGGKLLGDGLNTMGNFLRMIGSQLSHEAHMQSIQGAHRRRMDDWQFQAQQASKEIEQLQKQILASEIRIAIAEQELENLRQQQDQAEEVETFLKSKFTNQELYHWMASQTSTLYFQSYKLALELARKAQKCYRMEQCDDTATFIGATYWDNLKKGLLSGETLQLDLRRMEAAYLQRNERELELTKHISLALLNPLELIKLRETGTCSFKIPEVLFDLDHPGHYLRRIKSVSLTLPCVAGPYTSVSATLTLQSSRIRKKTTTESEYTWEDGNFDDDRFNYDIRGIQSIATSTAQNDSGLFELNFNDDRYLPFEGAGAISTWRLKLPTEFRQFNYDTISDVILHLRYTAQDGGADLKDPANQEVARLFAEASAAVPLIRAFSAKQEFGSEWRQFLHPKATEASHKLDLAITPNRFPFQFRGKNISISKLEIFLKFKDIKDPTTYKATNTLLGAEALGTPLGDYAAGQPLDLHLMLPGPNSSPQSGPLSSNPQFFQGTPHADFEAAIPHAVKASDHWTIEAKDTKIGAICPTLRTSVDGHNRLKAEAIDDLIIVCHYSVQV